MSDKLYPVSESFRRQTLMDKASYQAWYQESLEQPDTFWRKRAEELVSWDAPFTQISDCDMAKGEANWFVGGKLNVSVNCIDRHLPTRGDQTAIIWEADEPGQHQYITYKELHREVCRFANVLKAQGIKKGDRVCIYMPMIPQAAYAMLACTRIGAIHSVVFGGFSPEALRDRIEDGQCVLLITADEGRRGGRSFALKQNADIALAKGCESLKTCLVVKHTGGQIDWQAGRDIWLHDALQNVGDDCAPESMDAEDPLYILYTSGSTGKPKGVLHTTGGYLVNCALTHKYVFDYHEGEVYWCTADVGWVTGHSYILYGPLANGATTLMFEGVPTYPTASRCWQVVDTHQVNIFYTAPTAIRALMAQGDEFVTQTSRASLKLIGSVGEPINPEAWEWYHKVVGESRCPVVDTWWQTETGCIMIAPLPGATDQKPGSATLPLFGIEPVLMDDDGKEITGVGAGKLAIKRSWPSQIRSVYGNPQRMFDTYFSAYPGYYFSGDGARRDADGYFWITGRVDDVINVSGHRLGTAEIESALVLHAAVAEAAVVGYDHHIKGQAIYAYVDLIKGHAPSTALEDELRAMVAKEIGAFAKPELIQFVTGLPKTRSAKIMRRILRKIASNDIDNLGDTSTLADASVVTRLVDERKNR